MKLRKMLFFFKKKKERERINAFKKQQQQEKKKTALANVIGGVCSDPWARLKSHTHAHTDGGARESRAQNREEKKKSQINVGRAHTTAGKAECCFFFPLFSPTLSLSLSAFRSPSLVLSAFFPQPLLEPLPTQVGPTYLAMRSL